MNMKYKLDNFKDIADENMDDIFMSDSLKRRIINECYSSETAKKPKDSILRRLFFNKTIFAICSCAIFALVLIVANQAIKSKNSTIVLQETPRVNQEGSKSNISQDAKADIIYSDNYSKNISSDIQQDINVVAQGLEEQFSKYFKDESILDNVQYFDVNFENAKKAGYNIIAPKEKSDYVIDIMLFYKGFYLMQIRDEKNKFAIMKWNDNLKYDNDQEITPYEDIVFELDGQKYIISAFGLSGTEKIKAMQKVIDDFAGVR